MALFLQALRLAMTASLGYFINDVGDGVSKLFPSSQEENGKTRWWVVVLLIVAGSFLIVFVLWLVVPSKYRKK